MQLAAHVAAAVRNVTAAGGAGAREAVREAVRVAVRKSAATDIEEVLRRHGGEVQVPAHALAALLPVARVESGPDALECGHGWDAALCRTGMTLFHTSTLRRRW